MIIVNNKEKYLEDINKRFNFKARDVLISQVELFYQNNDNIVKNKYKIVALVVDGGKVI